MGFFGKIIKLRIFWTVLVFFALFLLPWWLSLFLILAGIFFYPFYFEGVALALLLDFLYGTPASRLFGLGATAAAVGLFFALELYFKKRLRWFND